MGVVMQEIIRQLIEIQSYDNRIAELEKFLSNVPEYLVAAENKKNEIELKYSDLSQNLEKTKEEKLELEAAYEERKAFLEKAQKKLSTVKNNKEYEAVLKELDQLKKNINDDEMKLVTLTENFEKLTQEYSGAEEEINKYVNDYEEKSKQKIEDDSKMQKEYDELKIKRADLASKIKKSIFSKYEKIRNARSNLAIVRVTDEVCSGCYMKIPPQLYVDVKKNNDLLQCPNCQRFLYYKEEES
jgi:predicted  nucleic acid-binding Zn-ribbon protein